MKSNTSLNNLVMNINNSWNRPPGELFQKYINKPIHSVFTIYFSEHISDYKHFTDPTNKYDESPNYIFISFVITKAFEGIDTILDISKPFIQSIIQYIVKW